MATLKSAVRVLLASRVWRTAAHLSTAGQIVAWASALAGGTLIASALSVVTEVESWLLALLVAAMTFLVYGVLLVLWERTHPAPAAHMDLPFGLYNIPREAVPTVREWSHDGSEVLRAPASGEYRLEGVSLLDDIAAEDAQTMAETAEDEAYFQGARTTEPSQDSEPQQDGEPPTDFGTEPPADWTGQFWRGKQITPCAWDDFRTTSDDNWNDHLETHRDPPTPQYEKEVSLVPRQWAKQSIHYLGDGAAYFSGVPADPDHTLYVTDAYAQELAATGLYAAGPVPKQAHVLASAGPPLVCRCGHKARNTAWFQSHLHRESI